MNYYFLTVMILVCNVSFAQEPVLMDNLNRGMDSIVKKYKIPNYELDPARFNETINQARMDAYQQIKSGNAEETALKRLDADYNLRNALSILRSVLPKATDPKKNMDSLVYSNTDPDNAALYKRSFAYRLWVGGYLDKMYQTKYRTDTTFKHMKNAVALSLIPVSVITGEIQNPFIRDYECFRHTSFDLEVIRKDTALARRIYQDFNAAVTNTWYRDKIRKDYDTYKRMNIAGVAAPDFTYAGVDGKQLTLSSLHGKYVYIDLWSTYCHNCIEQFPFLAEIEEQYKDKNIEFVSVSLDAQANKNRWRKFVADHKLTGYQLIADKDFKSDFIKKLNLVAIPRFILIDPVGNIVDGDAKMPSNPELKKQLDELLNEKKGI